MNGNKVPSWQNLSQYSVNRAGDGEAIRQTLYDFQTYNSAGQTSLSFFQTPIGQNSKTVADTNMELAGVLPNPKNFLVQSIEIHFFPGVDVTTAETAVALTESEFSNDVYALAKGGSLDFFIGSKTYLEEAPLGRFPPKTKLEVSGAYGATSEAATAGTDNIALKMDYAAMCGRPYYVDPWVLLISQQNFNVTLSWPTAVALPSGQNARIGVVLDGILYRLSQ